MYGNFISTLRPYKIILKLNVYRTDKEMEGCATL